MPKKFLGENPRAVTARERKATAKAAEELAKQKAQEEQYWKDELVIRRQQKREEHERKKQALLERKALNRAAIEKEIDSIIKMAKRVPSVKLTRAQIGANRQNVTRGNKVASSGYNKMEQNLNRVHAEGDNARSVTEAIAILRDKGETKDKHPEKRRKAEYLAYEQSRLRELKVENPTLRLSQMKQIIFKEWQNAPENPLNRLSRT